MSDRTPIERFVEVYGSDILQCDGWDYRALLPMWTWHGLDGFPNGDRIGKDPPFVLAEFRDPGLQASRRVAANVDDTATGLFYYRDWTSSGLQTDDSPIYWSGFWFQRVGDAVALTTALAARNDAIWTANWMEDFETVRRRMNADRDARW